MHQISFGNVLKEARLARGLDLAVVSRELRIRQDILVAIENSDFSRMPSRGYARNMIIAYARLVGLNPQDISRMYLDQEYAHQVEKAHRSVGNTIQMHNEPYQHSDTDQSGQTSRFDRVDSGRRSRATSYSNNRRDVLRTEQSSVYDGSSNGFGRRMYSQNADDPTFAPRNNAPVAHRARRSAMTDGRYTNLYSAPKNIPNPNRNRNLVIGAVVVLLLIVILIVALVLTHRSEPQTNIPVTGVDVTAQQTTTNDAQEQPVTETPPTEFTLRYEVADGSESYIEVYVDDDVQESSTVTGPAQESYTSSGTIRFVSTETKGVSLYINDEEVDLKTNDSGIVNTTYSFDDILDQWYKDHPDVPRNGSKDSSSSDSNDSDTASDESSDTSDEDNSSTSARSSQSSSDSSSEE